MTTLATSPPALMQSQSLPSVPTTPSSSAPVTPITPSSGSKPFKPNPHPYAIKTTSTGVLSRSNSSGHNTPDAYFYTPPKSPTPHSISPTRTRERVDSTQSRNGKRNSEYRGHRYSTSLSNAADYEVRSNGKSSRSGSEGSIGESGSVLIHRTPEPQRSVPDNGPTPPSQPRFNNKRAETLPSFSPSPSQSPIVSSAPSTFLTPESGHTSGLGGHAMGMDDLQSNPKLWTPSQLSAYLVTALRVRTRTNSAETAPLPAPVAKDIAAWVKRAGITGRVFLRWGEDDLEGLGLNLLWRTALLNASRNLRSNVLKGRIWGPPSPLPSPSPSNRAGFLENKELPGTPTADEDEVEGSGRFNFSSTLYSSASSTSSLDLPASLSDNMSVSTGSAPASIRRKGRVSRTKFKGRPSAGIGEADGRVKGMVDKWEVKSNGSVSGSENEGENDDLGGGWVATRRKSTRRNIGLEESGSGNESGISGGESEGEAEVDVKGGTGNWDLGAIVGNGLEEVNGGALDVFSSKPEADDSAVATMKLHINAHAFPADESVQYEEEPSIEELLATESQSPPNLASSARSWGARAWEAMDTGDTVKRVSASPEKQPQPELKQEDEWVPARKVAPIEDEWDFDGMVGSVRGSMKGSMGKKMKIGMGTGSVRLKDKGDRKGLNGLFDGPPPVESLEEAEESYIAPPPPELETEVDTAIEPPSAMAVTRDEPAPELLAALDRIEATMQQQVQGAKEMLELFRARLEEVEKKVKDMEDQEEARERELALERARRAELVKVHEEEVQVLNAKLKDSTEKAEALEKELQDATEALKHQLARASSLNPQSATTGEAPISTTVDIDPEPSLSVPNLDINPTVTLAKLVPSFSRGGAEGASTQSESQGPHELSDLPSYVVMAGLGVCAVVLQVVFRKVLTGRRS